MVNISLSPGASSIRSKEKPKRKRRTCANTCSARRSLFVNWCIPRQQTARLLRYTVIIRRHSGYHSRQVDSQRLNRIIAEYRIRQNSSGLSKDILPDYRLSADNRYRTYKTIGHFRCKRQYYKIGTSHIITPDKQKAAPTLPFSFREKRT